MRWPNELPHPGQATSSAQLIRLEAIVNRIWVRSERAAEALAYLAEVLAEDAPTASQAAADLRRIRRQLADWQRAHVTDVASPAGGEDH